MCACLPAFGATIYVTSIRSSEVQVIINGAAVRTLRPGETTPEGVRLREIRGATATFEVGGRAIALGLGQSTVAETLLRADRSGHFIVNAAINGMPVRGVIDTGATTVTLNMELARRIGLDWSASRRVVAQTANGPAAGWEVPLRSFRSVTSRLPTCPPWSSREVPRSCRSS